VSNFGVAKGFFSLHSKAWCCRDGNQNQVAIYFFGTSKFDVKLWNAKSFLFPLNALKFNVELWKAKSFMFLALKSSVLNFGALKGLFSSW